MSCDVLAPKCAIADPEDANIDDMPKALESGDFEGGIEVVMSDGREEAEAKDTNIDDMGVESVQPSINDSVSVMVSLLNNLLTWNEQDNSLSLLAKNVSATEIGSQVPEEAGRSKRKRVPQRLADALNGCLCGLVLSSSSRGVLKCKQPGCETQWVSKHLCGW